MSPTIPMMPGRRLICAAALVGLVSVGLTDPAFAADPPEVIAGRSQTIKTTSPDADVFFGFALPAGTWTATASVTIDNDTSIPWPVKCILYVAINSFGASASASTHVGAKQLGSLSMTTAHTLTGPGGVTVQCASRSRGSSVSVFDVNIVATRVNALTVTNID